MSVTGLGTARRSSLRVPILALLSGGLLLAALVLLAMELARFSSTRDVLQTDITVGGVPVGGLPLTEAVKAWSYVYSQPVQLDYGDSPIWLMPSQIGFYTKDDQMRGQVQSRAAGSNNYWRDFWNYLWRRPTAPLDIPLAADYQQAKLTDFLKDVAARYEERAGSASFDLTTMTFNNGANGARIDIEAARNLIDQALRRPTNRRVTLPLKSEGAREKNMNTLRDAITQFLKNIDYLGGKGLPFDSPATIGSVVVIDLQTGQEMAINPDVAFSAMSTIKIPILINRFRTLTFEPSVELKWLMAASLLCSSNSASNYLMQTSGVGNTENDMLRDGLKQVITTMQALGAKNTFIDAPLYVADKTYQYSIGAPKTNPDPHFNAHADPFSQTTAEDMAILLQELYDCSEYGSGLRTIYPDAYTQTECKQMVELLSGNVIGRLLELGIPPGTRLAHKNGWGGTARDGANVSDAGIVYSPGGNYIIAVYIWESRANQDGIGSLDTWKAVEGISRITYNYFNPDQPLMVSRVPENPMGAIDCVMPNAQHPERVDLNNIKSGRFDENGNIVPDACVNFPACTTKGNATAAPVK